MVRLFQNDRFLIRRVYGTGMFALFDMKNRRNVGNGKCQDLVFFSREDAEVARKEMTARVALLSCDSTVREIAFAE